MGLRPRKITVSFWRVNPTSDNELVTEMLAKAFDALECTSLDSIGKGATHALDCYAVEEKDGYLSGALVSNQHANLPLAYTQKRKQFGRVPLSEGEGLSRVSCFVFEKRRRLLILESTGEGGATARDWCSYFHAMLHKFKKGAKDRIPIMSASVIPQLDSRAIFNKFNRFTRIKVRIARLRDVTMFQDEAAKKATTSFLPIADQSGSDEVVCEFKVPSRPDKRARKYLGTKPSLNKPFVEKVIDACNVFGPGEIKTLEVSGEEEDIERTTVLDMLTSRLSDTIFAVPFTDRELPNHVAVRHRCELIKEMFDKHESVLQSAGGR